MPVSPHANDAMLSCRVGFVVTKKIGNAVIRNRVKRRLRAIVDTIFPEQECAGRDYVVIARPQTLTRPHSELKEDLETALQGLHRKMKRESPRD
jgi:ribonuclease P protein component